jgi:hypothetical protein
MHQGSCLCGSVKYSIDDELKFVVNCHCRFCSKAHGAPFTTLLFMPFDKFEVVEGQTLLSSYEVKTLPRTVSADKADRRFRRSTGEGVHKMAGREQ